MRALAAYIMRGRIQALLVAAAFAVGSLILPPFSYFSGAAVSLVTLRLGAAQGLQVVIGATLVAGLVLGLLTGSPLAGFGFVLVLWLPLWLLSQIWRITVSLPITLLALAGWAVVILAVIYGLVDNPANWWQQHLDKGLQPMLESAGVKADSEEGRHLVLTMSALMTGIVTASYILSLAVCLLIARWWQAMLYNPGGFRQEFHALRLGRLAGGIILVLLVLASLQAGLVTTLARDMLMVMLSLSLLPGLALVHYLVAWRKASIGWLIVMYGLLLFALPQTGAVLTMLAFADVGLNIRARLQAKPGTGNED
jgi:hypothetical protein